MAKLFSMGFFCALVFTVVSPSVAAIGEEMWLLVEESRESLMEGDSVRALNMLLQAKEIDSVSPEIDLALAELHRDLGDYTTALRYYNQVLDRQSLLDIPQMALSTRYAMADIYADRMETERLQEILEYLIDLDRADDDFLDPNSRFRRQVLEYLRANGPGAALQLYRLEYGVATEAHFRMAMLLQTEGNHQAAVNHAIVAFFQYFSEAIAALLDRQIIASVESLDQLMEQIYSVAFLEPWIQWRSPIDIVLFAYESLARTASNIGQPWKDDLEIVLERWGSPGQVALYEQILAYIENQ